MTKMANCSPVRLWTMPCRAQMASPCSHTARTETPSPSNPLGVKGAGEMGTIAGTVTVANAVMDALASLGIRHLEMPFTAEKIYNAIHNAK